MTSSVSGQDEPNLVLWLATRAGKMELSCPLGIRGLSRKYNLSCFGVLSHIINPLLTKLDQSRWLYIGLVLFCMFMDQYPANLTSCFVNNPYILHVSCCREPDTCSVWMKGIKTEFQEDNHELWSPTHEIIIINNYR